MLSVLPKAFAFKDEYTTIQEEDEKVLATNVDVNKMAVCFW
jgi:hypothetical protein